MGAGFGIFMGFECGIRKGNRGIRDVNSYLTKQGGKAGFTGKDEQESLI